MSHTLEVKGFGVEITYSNEPLEVFIARNRDGTESGLRRVDYNHYGTRHRSMIRYCAHTPNSIGFVISQDGEVRIMTQVGGKVVVWENVKLQLHYGFVRRKTTKQKKS
jgi:hypothetical protein